MSDQDNQNPSDTSTWRDNLPEEIRGLPSIQDVPDVATLVKNYDSTKAMVGSSVRIPTDDAGQEAIDAFVGKLVDNSHLGLMRKPDPDNPEALAEVYRSLGAPEEASGYERPDGVDAEMFGALAETAKAAGLTQAQYAQLSMAQNQLYSDTVAKLEESRMADVKQLEGEWGMAFGERMTRAADTVKALGGHPALESALQNNTADAATIRLFDTIAQQLGKENSELSKQVKQVTQETPDELRQRRAELINRQLTENLTQQQREALQKKVVEISNKLSAIG